MSTMTYTIALVSATVVALLAIALVVRGRARRSARAARREAAVGRLAASLERVAHELEWRPSPPAPTLARAIGAVDGTSPQHLGPATPADPTTGLPARAALVDALVRDVASTRRAGGRLGLALVDVEASGTGLEAAMAEAARAARAAAPEASTFRSGERSLTLVIPAAGRADAIAAVARIEATLGGAPAVRASVVELEPDEDAAALLARLASVGR